MQINSLCCLFIIALCGIVCILANAPPPAALYSGDSKLNADLAHSDEYQTRLIAASETDHLNEIDEMHEDEQSVDNSGERGIGISAPHSPLRPISGRCKSRRKVEIEHLPKIDDKIFHILLTASDPALNIYSRADDSIENVTSSDSIDSYSNSNSSSNSTVEQDQMLAPTSTNKTASAAAILCDPMVLLFKELMRLFSSYSFQGIAFSVSKSMFVWNMVSFYVRIPITSNFPVYDSVLQLPKMSIVFGFSYPFALRFSASASVPLQTMISLITILNAIVSEPAGRYDSDAEMDGTNSTQSGGAGAEKTAGSYFRNNDRLMLFRPYLATTKSAWRYSMSFNCKYTRRGGLIRYISPSVTLTPGLRFTQGVKPIFTLLSTLLLMAVRIVKKSLVMIRDGVYWSITLALIRLINAIGRMLGLAMLRRFGRDTFEEVIEEVAEEEDDDSVMATVDDTSTADELEIGSGVPSERRKKASDKPKKKRTTLRRKKSKKKKKRKSLNVQEGIDMTDFETYVAKSAEEVELHNSVIGLLAFGKIWRKMSYFFARKFSRLWVSLGVSFSDPPGHGNFWGSTGFELSPFFPLSTIFARWGRRRFSSFGSEVDVSDSALGASSSSKSNAADVGAGDADVASSSDPDIDAGNNNSSSDDGSSNISGSDVESERPETTDLPVADKSKVKSEDGRSERRSSRSKQLANADSKSDALV